MLNPEIQNFLSSIWEQFLIYLKNLWTTCARFFTSSPTVTPIQNIPDYPLDVISIQEEFREDFHLGEERTEIVNLGQEVILTEKPHPFDNFISIFKGVDPEVYLWTAGVIVFSVVSLIFNQTQGQTETYNPQITL